MDSNIKNSIKARYNSFSYSYELSDEYKKRIDQLFSEINEFGKTCTDVADFETKFATSDLNKKYMDLFMEVGQKCKPNVFDSNENPEDNEVIKSIIDEASSEAKYQSESILQPARRKMRAEVDSKLRDTPLGKVEQVSNLHYLFKRFKKNKNKENEE